MEVNFRLIGRRIHEIRQDSELSQMDLQDVCVYRFLVVVNGVAFLETVDEITWEQSFRDGPVSFAMFYLVSITMVCVREIVKTYVYPVIRAVAVELDDRQRHPVLPGHDLQRSYVVVVYFVLLGLCLAEGCR